MAAPIRTYAQVAADVRLIEMGLGALARDLEAARPDTPWTVEGAKHIIARIADAERLLNEAKRVVDDAKRDALRRRVGGVL